MGEKGGGGGGYKNKRSEEEKGIDTGVTGTNSGPKCPSYNSPKARGQGGDLTSPSAFSQDPEDVEGEVSFTLISLLGKLSSFLSYWREWEAV